MGVNVNVARLYERQAARAKSLGTHARAEDLFIHFGHWDEPDRAVIDEASFQQAQAALNARLLELADLRNGMRVLDVGCGVGGTLASVNAQWQSMDLHGVNIDPAQVEAARTCVRSRQTNSIAFHTADAMALPFSSGSFDRVFAIECIPHFASRAAFLAEAARVLEAGGRLVISDFVPTPELRTLRDTCKLPPNFAELITQGLGPWNDLFGDCGTTSSLASSAGWDRVAQIDATAETAPTYACILRAPPERILADAHANPEARGMAALAWAQFRGLLRMIYFSFQRSSTLAIQNNV